MRWNYLYCNRYRCKFMCQNKNCYHYTAAFSISSKWHIHKHNLLWLVQRKRLCCSNRRHQSLYIFMVAWQLNHFLPHRTLSHACVNLHRYRCKRMLHCLFDKHYSATRSHGDCYRHKSLMQWSLHGFSNCNGIGRNGHLYLFLVERMRHIRLHRIMHGKLYAHIIRCQWLHRNSNHYAYRTAHFYCFSNGNKHYLFQ